MREAAPTPVILLAATRAWHVKHSHSGGALGSLHITTFNEGRKALPIGLKCLLIRSHTRLPDASLEQRVRKPMPPATNLRQIRTVCETTPPGDATTQAMRHHYPQPE